jgi:hypothetical protein
VASAKLPLEEQALVAGTLQNLSNLLFLDIYGDYIQIQRIIKNDNRYSKVKQNTPLLAVRPKGPQITFFSQCKNA